MKSMLLLLMLSIGFFACKEDDDEHNSGSALKGCCGNNAIDEAVGNGHIYVPNIFTPNGDGINDYILVFGHNITMVVEFEIRDKSGKVVYEIFDGDINDFVGGWDGKVDGVVVEGMYNVKVSVLAADGTNQTLEGKVCNFVCDGVDVTEKVPGENCQFPVQVDGDGFYCPICESGEGVDCYE